MSNEELATLVKDGHREYLPQLWEQTEKFIRVKAEQRVRSDPRYKQLEDDLYQSGYFALLRAIDGYETAAGLSFIGYLNLHLKGAFAETLGTRTFKQKQDPLNHAISIDEPIGESEEGAWAIIDTLSDPRAEEAFENVTDLARRGEIKKMLQEAATSLNEDETAFFGALLKNNNHNISRTAEQLGMNRYQGAAIYYKIKRKLRLYFDIRKAQLEEMDYIFGRAYHHVSWNAWKYRIFTSQTEEVALDLVERSRASQ